MRKQTAKLLLIGIAVVFFSACSIKHQLFQETAPHQESLIPSDSDGDGVIDAQDICPATVLSNTPIDSKGCPKLFISPKKYPLTFFFESNSAATSIKDEDNREIMRLVNFSKKYPKSSIMIEGHTDNTGSKDVNNKLSQKRADAVRDLLVVHGINSSAIKSSGFGDNRPFASNRTAEGRAMNRRVSIVFVDSHGTTHVQSK